MIDPTPEQIVDACGLEGSKACEFVLRSTGSEGWAAATEWMWSYPLSILAILITAFVANRVMRKAIRRAMNRVLDQDPSGRGTRARQAVRKRTPGMLLRTESVNMRTEARVRTLTTVLRSIGSVLIWFTALLSILQVLHVNLAPLIASAGLLGVAIGFGAQGMVRDFLAGVFLVIEDQFGVGDVVDLGEAKGTVEVITLRTTRVRDVHGTLWHVPNGQILRVANKSQEWARAVLDIEVDVSVVYESTAAIIQHVADAMAAEERWMVEVLETPQVWGIESFTAEGYTIRLVVKTRPAVQFAVMRELRIRLKSAFVEQGIRWPGQDDGNAAEAERLELARLVAEVAGVAGRGGAAPTESKPVRGDPAGPG